MTLAKRAGKPPRELAEAIVALGVTGLLAAFVVAWVSAAADDNLG